MKFFKKSFDLIVRLVERMNIHPFVSLAILITLLIFDVNRISYIHNALITKNHKPGKVAMDSWAIARELPEKNKKNNSTVKEH